MNIKKLRKAETAARAFLRAVDDIDTRAESDDHFWRMLGITGFRETAAVRRASMDLTRALADLRRPG